MGYSWWWDWRMRMGMIGEEMWGDEKRREGNGGEMKGNRSETEENGKGIEGKMGKIEGE